MSHFISGTDEPVDDFPYIPEPPSGTPGRKSLKKNVEILHTVPFSSTVLQYAWCFNVHLDLIFETTSYGSSRLTIFYFFYEKVRSAKFRQLTARVAQPSS